MFWLAVNCDSVFQRSNALRAAAGHLLQNCGAAYAHVASRIVHTRRSGREHAATRGDAATTLRPAYTYPHILPTRALLRFPGGWRTETLLRVASGGALG